MPEKRCATCGAKRSHSAHLRAVAGANYHEYADASQAGLKAITDARAAYQASQTHKDAYAPVRGAVCAFEAAGAPGDCYGPNTPHHTFPVGRAGNRQRAERVAPVVPACARHNTFASQDGIEWAESHFVTVGGRDWKFLMTDAEAIKLEADHREFKPASSLSALPKDNTK